MTQYHIKLWGLYLVVLQFEGMNIKSTAVLLGTLRLRFSWRWAIKMEVP